MDFYPRVCLSTSAPVRHFITLSYCRILYTACVCPIWIYRLCATLANIPFEYFRVTRCPVCVWRLPDRSPLRCSHICMLPNTSSCRRNRHPFYYVTTPLRALCMLVGVAFRIIGRLCLQGGNALAFPFALLPSPSVTITQAHIYNIYANVSVLAVSIPHALRVTLPLSLERVVSNISINPRRVTGTLPRWNHVAKVRRLFGIYNKIKQKKYLPLKLFCN